MRSEDADILVIPGLGGSGPGHWQSRWEKGLKTARRVDQADWDRPDRDTWRDNIQGAIASATKPVLLVAHSLGVLSAIDAALAAPGSIVGAFLVTPPDMEDESRAPPGLEAFSPMPCRALPFPSFLIASRTDPYCAFDKAERLAEGWSSVLMDAGDAGHINAESGHGPWPEGLLLLAKLLKTASPR